MAGESAGCKPTLPWLSAFTFGLSDRYPLFDEEGLGPDEWGPGRHDRVYRPLGPETFR